MRREPGLLLLRQLPPVRAALGLAQVSRPALAAAVFCQYTESHPRPAEGVVLALALRMLSITRQASRLGSVLLTCGAAACAGSGEESSAEDTSDGATMDGPDDGMQDDATGPTSGSPDGADGDDSEDDGEPEPDTATDDPDEPVPTPNDTPAPEPEPTNLAPTPTVPTAMPAPVPIPAQPIPVTLPAPGEAACGDACGNGTVDSCDICPPGAVPSEAALRVAPCDPAIAPAGLPCVPTPVCTRVSEQCDGAPPLGQTCEAIGFSGGTLGCGATCNRDESACDSCPDDERVVACDDRVLGIEGATVVALATQGDAIGLAWSSPSTGTAFGVFDSDLASVSPSTGVTGATSVLGVGTLPEGYLVAANSSVVVLDSMGGLVSERVATGMTAAFVSTGSESPLVVWTVGVGAVATLLDESGAEVWQTQLSDDVIELSYGSAVATEGGFLVALRTSANGVEVMRLDAATGEVTDVSAPGGSSTEYPQLASDGTSARAVWADFSGSPAVHFAALDARGARVGDPVVLGGSPDYFNRSPLALHGDDAMVLFGGYTGATGQGQALHVRRVDAAGATVYGDVRVQHDANFVSWPRIAPLGEQFVLAWVAGGLPGRVGLVKFAP